MIFELLKPKPILDQGSQEAIFALSAWASSSLDRNRFGGLKQLVTPSNQHFPGRADSVQGMAELIFARVQHYAGVDDWSFVVIDERQWLADGDGADHSTLAVAGTNTMQPSNERALPVPYNANQVSNPEALIASFAHIVAHYIAQSASEPPPGGEAAWPQAMELLAVHLGFGVMFANTAQTFRAGGCGSCRLPGSDRSSYLREEDLIYALALFALLNDVADSDVNRHLKSSLRGRYKRCRKSLMIGPQVDALRQLPQQP